jgi:hypothetical protein
VEGYVRRDAVPVYDGILMRKRRFGAVPTRNVETVLGTSLRGKASKDVDAAVC